MHPTTRRTEEPAPPTKYPCTVCSTLADGRTYHPWVACVIAKATGRDPLPFLQDAGRYFRDHPEEL